MVFILRYHLLRLIPNEETCYRLIIYLNQLIPKSKLLKQNATVQYCNWFSQAWEKYFIWSCLVFVVENGIDLPTISTCTIAAFFSILNREQAYFLILYCQVIRTIVAIVCVCVFSVIYVLERLWRCRCTKMLKIARVRGTNFVSMETNS